MRALLGTAGASDVENPFLIGGALVVDFVHAVASNLGAGEATAARFLDVLYNVTTVTALGVELGPFYRAACAADVLEARRVRRACQCFRAFRRFYVFDLRDWAAGRAPALTEGFSVYQAGCGTEYSPLLAPAAASDALSATALAGIGAGAGGGALLLGGLLFVALAGGRGRDVRRAPKDPSKPCAIVFTDIQSSTSLWARAPAEMSDAVEQHHRLMRAALAKHGGYEVKTIGDSFMCAFRDAGGAFTFALAVQAAMAKAAWPAAIDDVYEQLAEEAALEKGGDAAPHERYGLRVRVGAHWGVCSVQYDEVAVGYDYYGTVVNTAARVEGVGHGGQVLVTADLWRAVEEHADAARLLGDVAVTPLGPQPLRGLDAPLPLYQTLPAAYSHRRFGTLRLDIQADDDDSTSFATETITDTTEHHTTTTRSHSRGRPTLIQRLQQALHNRPHLISSALTSIQFLEALFSTSSVSWREETLRHVCKRWRIAHVEQASTNQLQKSSAAAQQQAEGDQEDAPVAQFCQRKDIFSLVVKTVIAADSRAAVQAKRNSSMIVKDFSEYHSSIVTTGHSSQHHQQQQQQQHRRHSLVNHSGTEGGGGGSSYLLQQHPSMMISAHQIPLQSAKEPLGVPDSYVIAVGDLM